MASVLDLVKHYQRNIERYPQDEQRLLRCIDKLFELDVKVQHLQETGVGRTVNALRKESGHVGQAARALVYKWKLMVASEESDQEGDHDSIVAQTIIRNGKELQERLKQSQNQSGSSRPDGILQRISTHNLYEKCSSSRTETITQPNSTPNQNEKCNSSRLESFKQPISAQNQYEKNSSSRSDQNEQKQTNGNYSANKRRHHSSEEEDPETKKRKHSSSSETEDNKKNILQIKTEPLESDSYGSDDSQSDDSDSDMSESSEEDRKATRKIKIEPTDQLKSPVKDPSSSHRHSEINKEEPSCSKRSHEPSEIHSKHRSSDSDKSPTKHKSDSGHKKSSKEHESSSEKKHKSDHKSSEKEKSSKESRSSSKHSSEKHKSSSQKAESSSEKHKNHSEKSKTEKHRSSSSHKSEKEKHKSSSVKEVSNDKHKSKESSSSSKDKSSSSKENSKDKSTSKDKSSSHKSEKKHSSSNDKSKSGDSKDKKEDRSSEKKSSHKSSSSSHKSKSSSSKSKEGIPKKKSEVNGNASDDDGIDCGSGASFADVLGMMAPPKSKKKLTPIKDAYSPNNSIGNDLSPAALLAPSAKLAPLPALEISALPEISPNYKPRPPPKFLPHFSDEDAISAGISSKNQRTKVYSGNKVLGKIPSLYDMCVQILQEHIDALEYTGGVPYEILKPVVDKGTPQQLFMLEHYNPYLMDDTDHLWQRHCEKHFRNKKRQEMETWREMYMRCQEEQEDRLRSLTANIRMTQEAKKAPIKQTKMAYVDSVVKPPRNIARKQAQHGTAFTASASPAARVAALAKSSNVLKGGVRAPPAAPVSASSINKPKKAPLMAKALQFMRGRKR